MESDEKYMREALREAHLAADAGEIPIGAVVVWKGRIIGRGHNQTEQLHDTTAHAEMLAITAATGTMGGKYLSDCTLYVTVEPCPMCAGAMAWSQLGRVVYGCVPAPWPGPSWAAWCTVPRTSAAATPSSPLPSSTPAPKPWAASSRKNASSSCWTSSVTNANPSDGS